MYVHVHHERMINKKSESVIQDKLCVCPSVRTYEYVGTDRPDGRTDAQTVVTADLAPGWGAKIYFFSIHMFHTCRVKSTNEATF